MAIKKINHLEIEEEADVIKKKNWLKRIGITVLFLVILAGLLGLTGGGGLFAHREIVSADNQINIRYPIITRFQTDERLTITLSPKIVSESRVTVSFNASYLNSIYVKQITPRPYQVTLQGNKIVYTFEVNSQGQPVVLSFLLAAENAGFLQTKININNLYEIPLKQFIYH